MPPIIASILGNSHDGAARSGMDMERVCCILLIFTVIAACGSKTITLVEPTLVTQQASGSARIRLGESTRADVRAALGEPLLESNFWRVELYRADGRHAEVDLFVLILIPILVGVSDHKIHRYVLVTYDTAGRVSQVSFGDHSEGIFDTLPERCVTIRADELTFAIDLDRPQWGPTLLAESNRLSEYLAERSHSTSCTLVVACAQDTGCPDEITIDDGEPFDPSPTTALSPRSAPCPKGSRESSDRFPRELVCTVPVLHAITVPPGQHRLRITSSVHDGSGEVSFECTAGNVLYGIVRSRVESVNSWSKARLQATAAMSIVSPEAWDAHNIVLYRNGRWMVEPELDR
jgi:hypothetical protein